MGEAGMGQRPRIVLGDRDTARRRSIANALQEDGYEVLETEDGRDVLGYAEYLAAVMGRRRGNGTISADSFAIVADPELEGLRAPGPSPLALSARTSATRSVTCSLASANTLLTPSLAASSPRTSNRATGRKVAPATGTTAGPTTAAPRPITRPPPHPPRVSSSK